MKIVAKEPTVAEQMDEHELFASPKQNPLAARRHTTFVVVEGDRLQTPPQQQ